MNIKTKSCKLQNAGCAVTTLHLCEQRQVLKLIVSKVELLASQLTVVLACCGVFSALIVHRFAGQIYM